VTPGGGRWAPSAPTIPCSGSSCPRVAPTPSWLAPSTGCGARRGWRGPTSGCRSRPRTSTPWPSISTGRTPCGPAPTRGCGARPMADAGGRTRAPASSTPAPPGRWRGVDRACSEADGRGVYRWTGDQWARSSSQYGVVMFDTDPGGRLVASSMGDGVRTYDRGLWRTDAGGDDGPQPRRRSGRRARRERQLRARWAGLRRDHGGRRRSQRGRRADLEPELAAAGRRRGRLAGAADRVAAGRCPPIEGF